MSLSDTFVNFRVVKAHRRGPSARARVVIPSLLRTFRHFYARITLFLGARCTTVLPCLVYYPDYPVLCTAPPWVHHRTPPPSCPYPAVHARQPGPALTRALSESDITDTGVTESQKVTKVSEGGESPTQAKGSGTTLLRVLFPSSRVQESPRAGGTRNRHFLTF